MPLLVAELSSFDRPTVGSVRVVPISSPCRYSTPGGPEQVINLPVAQDGTTRPSPTYYSPSDILILVFCSLTGEQKLNLNSTMSSQALKYQYYKKKYYENNKNNIK